MVLLDTNIIIEVYKNNRLIINEIERIGEENICISVITAGELLYGALNRQELSFIRKNLKTITNIKIDGIICDKFIEIMDAYSLSHNLKIPDGLIAATALVYDIPIYTLNLKDFKPIKGIQLHQTLT
ncbi:MAG: type II toxin-antitoxin system VapC family toxin [Spirosomaceae bacterium]|jgi:hypothetical protein|nr:type II toxin-antitoxin system VapC family toxin [Spirosomataceae bacterium]